MYFLVIFVAMGGICLNLFLFQSDWPGVWYMLYPPFAFIRGVYVISASMFDPTFPQVTTEAVFAGKTELGWIYLFLFVESFVYLALAWYLDKVMPREYGVTLSPIFPFKWAYGKIRDKRESMFTNDIEIEEVCKLNTTRSYCRSAKRRC